MYIILFVQLDGYHGIILVGANHLTLENNVKNVINFRKFLDIKAKEENKV